MSFQLKFVDEKNKLHLVPGMLWTLRDAAAAASDLAEKKSTAAHDGRVWIYEVWTNHVGTLMIVQRSFGANERWEKVNE